MFHSRHPRSSRSLEQEKIIAQTFVKFLEDNNRKEEMLVDELRQIYQGEFRRLYNTLGMSFSKTLKILTYHINACQQLVIFGGGEGSPSTLRPSYCNVCKGNLGNGGAYSKHIEGVKPPQRAPEILRDVKTFGGIPLPRYSMAFSALLIFQLSVFVIVLFHYPSALVHGMPEEVSLKYFNSLKKLV